MLAAQVLGLGLGAADAHAVDAGRGPGAGRSLGTVVHEDEAELLDGAGPVAEPVSGPVNGAVNGPIDDLGKVLHQHLGTAELPLPGQHADRPDAFSLAARLLPAVPQQPRPGEDSRASRSGPANGRPGEPEVLVPVQRGPVDEPAPAPARPTAVSAPARPAAVRGTPLAAPDPATPAPPPSPAASAPASDGRLALAAASPARSGRTEGALAVLIPIAAGLLLTAAAMYKHRGLPGGH